ncbi:hypothetical protein [Pseudobacteriovorax antillogorgiicola]|uniref:Uncharacterized protein n=1 Tax=Pseudobacteriovorax antillogorgiicola TaxID=1513793 RepID=A0A1Y6BGA6_9BACT|nr:hypothetical protein [Pseudobacteriovorax antillogorgiicola]TCS57311.1 hypothetical protein EDD56_10351 [Pseudobacteriovorax antillogorgiicola]SMF02646.1 hypothetical protein SAMN06296036_103282 [Pseudobacteriovorax antillogorgiicola]
MGFASLYSLEMNELGDNMLAALLVLFAVMIGCGSGKFDDYQEPGSSPLAAQSESDDIKACKDCLQIRDGIYRGQSGQSLELREGLYRWNHLQGNILFQEQGIYLVSDDKLILAAASISCSSDDAVTTLDLAAINNRAEALFAGFLGLQATPQDLSQRSKGLEVLPPHKGEPSSLVIAGELFQFRTESRSLSSEEVDSCDDVVAALSGLALEQVYLAPERDYQPERFYPVQVEFDQARYIRVPDRAVIGRGAAGADWLSLQMVGAEASNFVQYCYQGDGSFETLGTEAPLSDRRSYGGPTWDSCSLASGASDGAQPLMVSGISEISAKIEGPGVQEDLQELSELMVILDTVIQLEKPISL